MICYACEKDISTNRDIICLYYFEEGKYKLKIDSDRKNNKGFHADCLRDMMGDEMFFEFFEEKKSELTEQYKQIIMSVRQCGKTKTTIEMMREEYSKLRERCKIIKTDLA